MINPFMKVKLVVGKMVAVGLLFGASVAQSATYTWDAGGGATTTWSEPTNWVGDSVPTFAATDTFDLSTIALSANGTSTVSSNQTLGIIKIAGSSNGTFTWTLNRTSTEVLTLDNGASASQINVLTTTVDGGPTNVISVPIAITGNLSIDNQARNKALALSGGISSAATSGIQTITTTGNAGFGGTISFSGGLSDGVSGGKIALVMNNTNCVVTLGTANSFTGGTTLTAGQVRVVTGSFGADGSALTINGNITLRNVSAASTLNLGTLNLSSDFLASGSNGDIVIAGATAVNLGNATRTITGGTGNADLDSNQIQFSGSGQTINNGTLRILGGTGATAAAPTAFQFNSVVTFNNANLEIGGNSTTRFTVANAFGTTPGSLPNVVVNTNGALNLSSRALGTGTGSFDLTIASLAGSGNVTNSSGTAGTAVLSLAGSTSTTFSGVIRDGGYNSTTLGKIALTKSGSATQTLNGTNTYSGATSITAGTLVIAGTGSINNTSGVALNGATAALRYNSSTNLTQTLTWTQGRLEGTNWGGSLGGLTVGTNQILSPGNSPGTAATSSQTWAGGGTYVWELNNATGTAGTDPGWDLITGTGALTITATSGSKFNINITSLTLGNVAGDAANFSSATNYNWLLADFTGAITFDAAAFALNTSGFSNAFTGTFDIARGDAVGIGGDASQLYITYTIPEPSTAILVSLVLTAAVIFRRRARI
jgi:autotransporter-associated beta strand protein